MAEIWTVKCGRRLLKWHPGTPTPDVHTRAESPPLECGCDLCLASNSLNTGPR